MKRAFILLLLLLALSPGVMQAVEVPESQAPQETGCSTEGVPLAEGHGARRLRREASRVGRGNFRKQAPLPVLNTHPLGWDEKHPDFSL